LYDIRPGNGAGQFLQPRSPHGASRQRQRMNSLKFHLVTDMSVAQLPDLPQGPTRSTFSAVAAVWGVWLPECLSTVLCLSFFFWQPPKTSLVPNLTWKHKF